MIDIKNKKIVVVAMLVVTCAMRRRLLSVQTMKDSGILRLIKKSVLIVIFARKFVR